jgi:two-component system, OmpR family, sensor histidine kinase KdpD
MAEQRPDPDALLRKIEWQEEKARRGRLKVFFGAAAGVGKTYAMLGEARELRAQGVDVVAGLVETHGRAETEALLEVWSGCQDAQWPIAAPTSRSSISMPPSSVTPL